VVQDAMRNGKLGIKRLTVKRICYACGSDKTIKIDVDMISGT
jgi:hypothetical protein